MPTQLRYLSTLTAVSLCAAFVAVSSQARAQKLGATVAIGDSKALWNDQAKELGDGPAGRLALQLWLAPEIGVQLAGTALSLGAGDPPINPRLAARGQASLYGGSLGLVARPWASKYNGSAVNAAGLWVDAGGGLADTGKLLRGTAEVNLGFDFWVGEGFGVGPAVGLLYVVQPNDTIRPDDAPIGLFMLHGAFVPLKVPAELKPIKVVGDRDGDGIDDEKDVCPDDPEDKDGFQDEDGCPDPDNDHDRVPDRVDKCPMVAEDRDGFEDEDGCPDPDNDQDGILDADDKCPNEPEDKDGFEDEDGCPDPDNDKDRILDVVDKCPNEPETYNGYADEDGCPDEVDVRVVGDQIILDDRIFFHVNLRTIQSRSFPLIQRLAKLLIAHPQYLLVSIEGHADATGDEKYNQKLSEDRAKEVKARLVHDGVSADRLTVVGYGESRPAAAGTSQADLRKNRRVEFRITRQVITSGATPPAGDKAGGSK